MWIHYNWSSKKIGALARPNAVEELKTRHGTGLIELMMMMMIIEVIVTRLRHAALFLLTIALVFVTLVTSSSNAG